MTFDQPGPQALGPDPELLKRMDWGLLLLAVIAALLVVR
jgi:hypothetical protein